MVENSRRGLSIRCSLFGDQKVLKVACPDSTDFTRPAYHHSSANGTFTSLIRINARVKSAATVQSSAATKTALLEREYFERVTIKRVILAGCNLVSHPAF